MARAELKTIATLDGKPFERSVDKVQRKTQGFKQTLFGMKGAIAGAFAVGAIVAFGRKMLKTADDLQTAANIFGLTMETVIAFQSVMAESGIGAERFNKIFGRIKTMQADVAAGLKTYTRELDKMKITQEEIKGLGVDEVFLLLAKRYGEATDKGEFLEAMTKLLGTRLIELVEVFQRINKEGMEKFIEEAEAAAAGMRDLAAASDQLEKVGNKLIIWTAQFVGGLGNVIAAVKELSVEMGVLKTTALALGSPIIAAIEIGKRMGERSVEADIAGRGGKPGPGGLPGAGAAGVDAQEEKWYKMKEASLLRQKDTLEKIAYHEQTLFALHKQEAEAPADLGIATQILEVEKKIEGLKSKAKKEAEGYAKTILDQDKKREDIYAQQDKLALEYQQKQEDIMAGKGITVDASRADRLQAIGGMVGGVSGAGAQQARIEERQAKILEESKQLHRDTVAKLTELNNTMFELVGE